MTAHESAVAANCGGSFRMWLANPPEELVHLIISEEACVLFNDLS